MGTDSHRLPDPQVAIVVVNRVRDVLGVEIIDLLLNIHRRCCPRELPGVVGPAQILEDRRPIEDQGLIGVARDAIWTPAAAAIVRDV